MPQQSLPDARPVAKRLSEIVYKAHKNPNFALIYGQRKTNQLLYAGFGTLAEGIYRMQDAITDSLNDLSSSLETRLEDLVSTSRAQANIISSLTDHVASSTEAQREYEKDSLNEEKKQTEILENMRRDR